MADGEAAAFKSAAEGDAKTLAGLLDEQPQLLHATSHGRRTLLLHAANRGHLEVVRLLIERGADVHCFDSAEYGTLHIAAYEGHEEVVALLLDAGAPAAMTTAQGNTPLSMASAEGHLGIVKLLLRHYTPEQMNYSDVEYQTALWLACYHGYAEIVMQLLLAGADHVRRDNGGQRPRDVAEENGHVACVRAIDCWEREQREVPLALHRARCLWELQANGAAGAQPRLPAFVSARTAAGQSMPQVEIVALGHGEGADVEERDSMVTYVITDMPSELYTELMASFHLLNEPKHCFWLEWGQECFGGDECGLWSDDDDDDDDGDY